MKPTCYVMVGVPATGKSTHIQKMVQMDPDLFVYSTDNFIDRVATEEGKTYSEVFADTIDEATKTMNSWLDTTIRERGNIAWDQTNLGVKKRAKIVRRLRNAGYNVEAIVFMHPDPVDTVGIYEWRERLEGRPGKIIPEHVLENMIERFEMPSYNEGFEKITVYNMYGVEIKNAIPSESASE